MENSAQKQPESLIVIRFATPNSTLLEVHYQNVSPLQAVAAAWVLEQEAKTTMMEQAESRKQQEQLSKIAVPGAVPGGGIMTP